MIKLNRNLKVGDIVRIPKYLSWQVDEDRLAGEYEIVSVRDDDFFDGEIELRRVSEHTSFDIITIYMTPACAAYLTGESVPNREVLEAIDPFEFQPDIDMDSYEKDYFTEDGQAFGFWYSGIRTGRPAKHKIVDSSMVQCLWCYVKFPWDEEQ